MLYFPSLWLLCNSNLDFLIPLPFSPRSRNKFFCWILKITFRSFSLWLRLVINFSEIKEERNVFMERGGRGGREERITRAVGWGSELLGCSTLVRSAGAQRAHRNGSQTKLLSPALDQLIGWGRGHNSPGLSSSCTKQLRRSRFSRNLIQNLWSQTRLYVRLVLWITTYHCSNFRDKLLSADQLWGGPWGCAGNRHQVARAWARQESRQTDPHLNPQNPGQTCEDTKPGLRRS